jgi:uncharacterized protein YfeS
MNDLQTVQNDLVTATSALDDLRSALRDGADVDLDAFNRMVAETCHAAVTLPKADAPKVRRQLERLLDELNEARDEIAAEQERLATEIAATMQPAAHDPAVLDDDEIAVD